MQRGSFAQNRKFMWMVNQLERALLSRKDDGIATLAFLQPEYEYLKIECYMVSKMQHMQPFGVFSKNQL